MIAIYIKTAGWQKKPLLIKKFKEYERNRLTSFNLLVTHSLILAAFASTCLASCNRSCL